MQKPLSEASANANLITLSEHFLAALDEGPLSLIVSKKSDGQFLEVNRAFCRMVGYSREELIGKSGLELGILDSDTGRQRTKETAHLREGTAINIELAFCTRTGDRRLLSASVTPISYQGEDCFLTFALDISTSRIQQRQLQQEKAFAEGLVNMAQAIILVLDPNGKIVRYNPYFEELSGYRLDEMQGKDWFDAFLPEQERARIRAVFNGAVNAPPTKGNQNPIITRSGEYRYIDWHATTLTDTAGNLSGLLCMGHDITERMQGDEALRVSEERFRCLFNSSFIGMVVADMHGGIIDANDAYLSLLGRTREELEAGSIRWDSITPPEWFDADLRALTELRASGVCHPMEKEYFRPDGSRVAVLGVAARLPGPGEQAICMFVDITQRKLTEDELTRHRHHLEEIVAQRTAELLESQQRLGLALDASAIGLWDVNLSTGVVYYDEGWYRMLGYSAEGIPPALESWKKLVHGDDWPGVNKAMDAHISGESANYESEFRLKHKDGHWVWVLAKGKIVERDAQGSPVRVIGTHLDISHQKRLSLDGVHLLQQIESLILRAAPRSGEISAKPASSRKPESDTLSRRQRQLLELIAGGHTSAEIAERLKIAPATAVSHRRELMRKLNLHSVADLTRYAIAQGLIQQ